MLPDATESSNVHMFKNKMQFSPSPPKPGSCFKNPFPRYPLRDFIRMIIGKDSAQWDFYFYDFLHQRFGRSQALKVNPYSIITWGEKEKNWVPPIVEFTFRHPYKFDIWVKMYFTNSLSVS